MDETMEFDMIPYDIILVITIAIVERYRRTFT